MRAMFFRTLSHLKDDIIVVGLQAQTSYVLQPLDVVSSGLLKSHLEDHSVATRSLLQKRLGTSYSMSVSCFVPYTISPLQLRLQLAASKRAVIGLQLVEDATPLNFEQRISRHSRSIPTASHLYLIHKKFHLLSKAA